MPSGGVAAVGLHPAVICVDGPTVDLKTQRIIPAWPLHYLYIDVLDWFQVKLYGKRQSRRPGKLDGCGPNGSWELLRSL